MLAPDRLPQLAVFDFDGTLSLLRSGWERVMHRMMLDTLAAVTPISAAVEEAVAGYIDASTGILTIDQMQWLHDYVAVADGSAEPPRTYKARYLARLDEVVADRVRTLQDRGAASETFVVPGARALLERLSALNVRIAIVSGTDQDAVQREVMTIGLAEFAAPTDVYGALDDSRANDKAQLIPRLVAEGGYDPDRVLVVGDGPVEIRCGRAIGARTWGVAFDEQRGGRADPRKVARLRAAGADTITEDLRQPVDVPSG